MPLPGGDREVIARKYHKAVLGSRLMRADNNHGEFYLDGRPTGAHTWKQLFHALEREVRDWFSRFGWSQHAPNKMKKILEGRFEINDMPIVIRHPWT